MTQPAAPEPFGPHLRATIDAWDAANDTAARLVSQHAATEVAVVVVLADLADRWDRDAATSEAALGHFDGPAAATLNAEVAERARIYRQAATDLREVLATGRVPADLLTPAERPAV